MSPRELVAPSGAVTRWGAIALGVAATAWGLALTGVVLQAVHGRRPVSVSYWLSDEVSAVVYAGVTLVVLPRVRHPVAWIMAATALGSGFAGFATQYYLLAAEAGGAPAADLVVLTGGWAWVPGTYATIAVLPWLVGGPTRWARVFVPVAGVAIAVAVLRLATLDYRGVDNPAAVTVAGWQDAVRAVGLWPDRVCVAVAVAGVVRLVVLRVRAGAEDGRGLGWLVVGQGFLTVAMVPVVVVPMGPVSVETTGLLVIAGQAFLPVALLVVVLRRRLWGVDAAVSRVTAWWLLTVTLLTSYAALVWSAGRLAPGMPGAAQILAVGLVVALAQPVRFRVQERVDRLVYGQGADPGRLLGTLTGDLGGGDPGDRLTAMVEALRVGLRLSGLEVRGADGEPRSRSGVLDEPGLDLPLVVGGVLHGRLLASAPVGERVDPRTRRAVEQLGGVLAVALQVAEVNDRLDAAGKRLAEVRSEERRLLRRDLQDGMGPALAGVVAGLADARRRLLTDPAGAAALLAGLETEVERRTQDVRLMARALLPAQLDRGDLAGALDVLAARFRSTGLEVDTDLRVPATLSGRRQVELYHAATEALVAAARRPDVVRVRLALGGDAAPTVTVVEVQGGDVREPAVAAP